MKYLIFVITCSLFIVGCEKQEPPVDVKALEEVETGPHGDIIQDD